MHIEILLDIKLPTQRKYQLTLDTQTNTSTPHTAYTDVSKH